MNSRNPPCVRHALPPLAVLRNSHGLSMLELIIAFVVLQVAIVTFAQFFTAGLDFSRRTRRIETAQLLGQSKMEELLRTADPALLPSAGESSTKLLNQQPGSFEPYVFAHSVDIEPYMWVAETERLVDPKHLLGITLHVYMIERWQKSGGSSQAEEDFYVSEDRKTFTYAHSLGDGSVEFIHGRERLRLSSAVALPPRQRP